MELKEYVSEFTPFLLESQQLHPIQIEAIKNQISANEIAHLVFIIGLGNRQMIEHDKIKPLYVGFATSENLFIEIGALLPLYAGDRQVNYLNLIPKKSRRDAYLLTAEIYHNFQAQLYNDHHPERPLNSGWLCKDETCKYKPPLPVRNVSV